MWKNLFVADTIGSEGGIVLADEEYKSSCRVTLEKCPKYYTITCGVYGAMAHTVFCSANNYKEKYVQIKVELQSFIDKDTIENEELEFYNYFTSKF